METRVLIVEDNRTNLMMMERLVAQVPGCSAIGFDDPLLFLGQMAGLAYDVALVDFQMPGMDGVALIKAMRSAPTYQDQPLVMITADTEKTIRLDALQAGAMEFLHKPIDPLEFKARLANIARLSIVQRQLSDRAAWLRSEVDRATAQLREREEEIIHRLALAAGYKDRETADHTRRMARYCRLVAEGLGLDEELCRDIELAAPMHDIGKVGIRDAVLLKPGPLDADERAHMNEHTAIGARILGGSRSRLMKLASEIAEAHHEHWDGSGYPRGIAGDAIPLAGRIAAVADVFDALTSERPYKAAWSLEQAFTYLKEKAGSQFDPACVEALCKGARQDRRCPRQDRRCRGCMKRQANGGAGFACWC
jgi:putative two-component system response regulator